MIENRNQFYLYDRWYYLTNETEDKLSYSSNPEDRRNGNILEVDKTKNKISIIYLSNNKTLGKLEMTQLESLKIKLNYSQYECKELAINDDIYNNLLFELVTITNPKHTEEKIEIVFKKKKKLNKICYREPKFPMNRKINLNELETDIYETYLFKQMVDHSNIIMPKIIKLINEPIEEEKQPDIKIEDSNLDRVKNLKVPEDIHVYDRKYHLVKTENDIIYYESTGCEISNLEIKVDTNNMNILGIELKMKDIEEEKHKYTIQIYKDKENNIAARYCNRKKTNVYLNHEKLEQARIHSEIAFDANNHNVVNKIKIDSQNKHYNLVAHPSSGYIDKEGNQYKVYCNDYVEFQSMGPFIGGIYKHVENSIFKEKELIKK